jgi:hypothetical protein
LHTHLLQLRNDWLRQAAKRFVEGLANPIRKQTLAYQLHGQSPGDWRLRYLIIAFVPMYMQAPDLRALTSLAPGAQPPVQKLYSLQPTFIVLRWNSAASSQRA